MSSQPNALPARGVTVNRLIIASCALAATATLAVVPTSAQATPAKTGQTLQQIQASGAVAIARREATLTTTIAAVGANTQITSADRATLNATLTGDQSGLSSLGQKLTADTTVAQASADYTTIYTGFRVYALAVPQVHFAAAADTITVTILPALSNAQQELTAVLAADPSKNTPAVQASMTDLASRISAVGSATDGLASSVLAYTPAQYDANHALLAAPRTSLRTAQLDVGAARADIVSVTKALG
jgi:hypothetical protein